MNLIAHKFLQSRNTASKRSRIPVWQLHAPCNTASRLVGRKVTAFDLNQEFLMPGTGHPKGKRSDRAMVIAYLDAH
jgi:hypothetical protein